MKNQFFKKSLARLITFFSKIVENGSFAQNLSFASFWNGISIILQIVLAPIITRIYSPIEYGAFAVFNSIVFNISIFSTLKYGDAIVLQKTLKGKNNNAALAVGLIFIFTFITFLILWIFKGSINALFANPAYTYVWVLIPIGIFLAGLSDVLVSINISEKKIFNNGLAGFANNISSRAVNISYGVLAKTKSWGLIIGDLVGKTLTILVLIFTFKDRCFRWRKFLQTISWNGIISVMKDYNSFPIYFLPSSILIIFSSHLPIYFFQWRYGAMVVGSFGLASGILDVFNKVIPYSFAPVFLQKANELKCISDEYLAERVFDVFLYMLLMSTLIFSGIALFSRVAFPLLFGESWVLAGSFASILALHYAFNFVAISLSEVYNVFGKQRFLLRVTIFGIGLKIISIMTIYYWHASQEVALTLYCTASALGSIITIMGVFHIQKYSIWRVWALLLISFSIILGLLFIGKLYF